MEGMRQGGPHPAREELERLMLGELLREEALSVVRHLLSGCQECLATTRRYWRLGNRPPGLENDLLEMATLVRTGGMHDEPGLI